LEQRRKHGAKLRNWLGAGCALALICAWASPRAAFAQGSASTSGTAGAKLRAKTANPKKHVKAAAKNSAAKNSAAKTTTSQRRAHPPSHLAADTQKLSTAPTAHNSKSKHASSRKTSKKRTARGQQKIDPERAQAIQEALIREHYMSGTAAGTWNQSSEEAMRRYQADHGWQSKTVPDSRALISLGLGPSHDHLLNPESAMVTGPFSPRTASLSSATQSPVSHSADPGAHMNTNPTLPADPAPAKAPEHDTSSPQ
jgi:hypothetical protein